MEVVHTGAVINPTSMYSGLNQFVMIPGIFIVILVIIVVYYGFAFASSNSSSASNAGFLDGLNTSSNNGSYSSIIWVIGLILLLLAVNHVLYYFFSIDVRALVTGLFSQKPVLDIIVEQPSSDGGIPQIKYKNQVFNVPGNYHTFDNAKAVCAAYGAKLATYEQVEHAYDRGGEWCNYGWSEGQMALFPTQKKTFAELQKKPGHEHDCGRPGINGGYIANPNVRFGVNCFGHKPKITQEEAELMKTETPYPQTAEELAFQKRVEFWRGKLGDLLVSPFNHRVWSQIL
jgi:hypothetical protein